jgi:hypothetical protein
MEWHRLRPVNTDPEHGAMKSSIIL